MLLVVVLFAALVNIASPQQDTGNVDNATLATTVSTPRPTPTPIVVIGAATGAISGVNVSGTPTPPPVIKPTPLPTGGTPSPNVPLPPASNYSVYSAKYLCGVPPGNPKPFEGGYPYPIGNLGPAVPATYMTGINIHNPYFFDVTFYKKVAPAASESDAPIAPSLFENYTLQPDHAVEIDCKDIAQLLQPPCPLCKYDTLTWSKGFVVLYIPQDRRNNQTPPSLDVIGVYTSMEGKDELSLEVTEPIQSKLIPGPSCPITNISLNTGFNQTSGTNISIGGMDDDWNVVVDSNNPAVRPATVVPISIRNEGNWPPPFPSSGWISVNASRGYRDQYAGENVTYQYNFTLPPCFSNPILNLTIRADNRAWVYLNTNNFVGKTVDLPGVSMLGTSTGFRSGMNSLTVVVHDDGIITGFDLVGNVTAN
jgi:hypothetical protein